LKKVVFDYLKQKS